MLAEITKYLNALFNTLPYIDSVLGMGESMDIDGALTPTYWHNGEPVHISFESHPSLVYMNKNGDVNRETVEDELIANTETITETYPLRAIVYRNGSEDINCESATQAIAQGIKKNISGIHKQFRAVVNAELVFIRVTRTNLNKAEIWRGISGSPIPGESSNLIAIDFDVVIKGNEQCFAGEPCIANDFVFASAAVSFCEMVAGCNVTPQKLEFNGNGTTTYVKSELFGKTLLLVATDGRIRKSTDYTFNSVTGTIQFISVIQTGQVIHILYK